MGFPATDRGGSLGGTTLLRPGHGHVLAFRPGWMGGQAALFGSGHSVQIDTSLIFLAKLQPLTTVCRTSVDQIGFRAPAGAGLRFTFGMGLATDIDNSGLRTSIALPINLIGTYEHYFATVVHTGARRSGPRAVTGLVESDFH